MEEFRGYVIKPCCPFAFCFVWFENRIIGDMYFRFSPLQRVWDAWGMKFQSFLGLSSSPIVNYLTFLSYLNFIWIMLCKKLYEMWNLFGVFMIPVMNIYFSKILHFYMPADNLFCMPISISVLTTLMYTYKLWKTGRSLIILGWVMVFESRLMRVALGQRLGRSRACVVTSRDSESRVDTKLSRPYFCDS